MRNIIFSLLTLIGVSCNQVVPVDNEVDFQKSLLSKFGQPDKIDTSFVDLPTSKIRYITYIYKKESAEKNIIYRYHNYIDKLFNSNATSTSDGLPARYDAEWNDYDLDFSVHLQGGRSRKTAIYDIYIQTICTTSQ